MERHTTHLVWDWNGTLFHDIDAVLGATNAAFAVIGLEPITLERYRELYCVPVPLFYERRMGRMPTDAEWLVMDEAFHRHYSEYRTRCALADGVDGLLAEWLAGGGSQSILSMFGHDELIPLVRGFGIESHFLRVDGRKGAWRGGKSADMVRHLAALESVEPGRTVVIGDAVDDAVAARHAGARAVLYTGGSHSRGSLEAAGAGVPIVDSLAEAVEAAASLAA